MKLLFFGLLLNEYRTTIFALPLNKVFSPDGFSVELFTSSWDIIGADLDLAVNELFTSRKLLTQLNTIVISLIPKVTGAEKFAEFCPISLFNTMYKVISRLLVARLKLLLPIAVQGNQVGFIKGRLLCKNVLLASKLVSNFHKPGPTLRGCLQVYLSKAYDNVNWTFILNISKAFDLPELFIKLISEFIFSIIFSGFQW